MSSENLYIILIISILINVIMLKSFIKNERNIEETISKKINYLTKSPLS